MSISERTLMLLPRIRRAAEPAPGLVFRRQQSIPLSASRKLIRRESGNGPFPTEQINEVGESLRKIGGEYGATTGRPRRCGWLDLFSLKYSVMINGIEDIALTKLDVLDEFDEIKVCVGYNYEGKPLKTFPLDLCTIEDIEPVYETLPGWKTKISGAKKLSDLPQNCQIYIDFIEKYLGTKLSLISVGAMRDQTIVR